MDFAVGNRLLVDGDDYKVVGKILYRNENDGMTWTEYRMLKCSSGSEYWLSVDDYYREYSISKVVHLANIKGYHEVDSGTEVVVQRWGDVDVDAGERAGFTEYEDDTEEKILSYEFWSDGEEISKGYYLDENEIELIEAGNGASDTPDRELKIAIRIVIGIFAAIFIFSIFSSFVDNSKKSISKYLKKSSRYTYETSITGAGSEKADIYTPTSSGMTIGNVAKDIIDGISGETENVQENTEEGDSSIAILTSKEYCFIYESEDGKVLIQISSRRYVYGSEDAPYKSTGHARRYYRRHYYSRAYKSDYSTYGSRTTSAWGGYNDGNLSNNSNDTYDSYSKSVRQASIKVRQSSGGGTSYGK